jgi:hypothetical protein
MPVFPCRHYRGKRIMSSRLVQKKLGRYNVKNKIKTKRIEARFNNMVLT